MPRGIHSVLSSHLTSEYRGPRILNEEGAPPPPATDPKDPPKEAPKEDPKPNQDDDFKKRLTALEDKNKELKVKLKEKEDAEKKAADDKLVEDGKIKDLLAQREKELADLTGSSESMKTKLEAYEKLAKEQVDTALKGITDTEKQKTVSDMLDGKPIEEQVAMLPKLLALVGSGTSFGSPTPTSTTTPDQTTEAAKQKRFDELLVKATAGTLTHQERAEKNKLATELSSFFKS